MKKIFNILFGSVMSLAAILVVVMFTWGLLDYLWKIVAEK